MEALHRRLQALLWPPAPPLGAPRAHLLNAARYLYALLRDLAAGELSMRAMSLVYTTMLATVPLLALSFAVLKGLGFHRQLEPFLLSVLEPIGPRAEELAANIMGFVDNVSGSALISLSLPLLLLWTLSMADKVEASFNYVWRVDRPRSLARRITDYLSVIVIVPIVMLTAMSLIASLSSTALVERLRGIEPLGAWLALLGDFTPYLFVIAGFGFLYVFIPNTRVRLGPAAIGGLAAGTAWVAAGQVFTTMVVSVSRYQAIYSGFAIVLVLMIWMYLSWLILLMGAQFAFYLQSPENLRHGSRTPVMSNALRERLALYTMLLVAKDFDTPAHGWRAQSLAARIGVPRHFLEPVLTALKGAGLLVETTEQRLMPGRDPHGVALGEILATVRRPGTDSASAGNECAVIDTLTAQIERSIDSALEHRTLAALVASDSGAGDSPGARPPE